MATAFSAAHKVFFAVSIVVALHLVVVSAGEAPPHTVCLNICFILNSDCDGWCKDSGYPLGGVCNIRSRKQLSSSSSSPSPASSSLGDGVVVPNVNYDCCCYVP